MESFISKFKEKLKSANNSASPKLQSHIDPNNEKTTGIFSALNLYNSADISDLGALNEAAVAYYNQIINNGGYDKDSDSYKAFMELLKILTTTEIRNKIFETNRSNLAANLKYYLDKYKKNSKIKINSQDDYKKFLNQQRLDVCRAVSKLNDSINTNPITKGYKFKIVNKINSKPLDSYCTTTQSNTNDAITKHLFSDSSNSIAVTDNGDNSAYVIGDQIKEVKYKYNDILGNIKDVDVNPLFKDKYITAEEASSGQKGGSDKYYKDALEKLRVAEELDDRYLVNNIIDEIEKHPLYSPKFEELTMNDRLIMILLTFIIRSFSLFLIQWGVDSAYIGSFKEALTYYIFIYTLIFLIIVALINNSYNDNISLKLLFYYINVEAQGYFRIIAHLLILYSLFPIIIILKDKSIKDKFSMLSYQEKSKVKNTLNMFTLASWIITSVVVLRF